MLILLLPVTTIVVALFGFYVWHRQLVRKRHFEVADAALSGFRRAEAAIAHAREPTVGNGEGATRKRAQYELSAYGHLLDRLYIPVERLKLHSSAFEELERAAVNVEVHFGSELAEQLREPLRAYHRIAVASAKWCIKRKHSAEMKKPIGANFSLSHKHQPIRRIKFFISPGTFGSKILVIISQE